jgi:hypothetical protein
MHSKLWRPIRFFSAAVLAVAVPQAVLAQTSNHVVSPLELQKAAQDAANARSENLATLMGFFGSAEARKALQEAHMNPAEVQNAVAGLSDQELAQLAQRATKAQSEFAAGTLSDHDLLIILIAIAALVLIIVAVR